MCPELLKRTSHSSVAEQTLDRTSEQPIGEGGSTPAITHWWSASRLHVSRRSLYGTDVAGQVRMAADLRKVHQNEARDRALKVSQPSQTPGYRPRHRYPNPGHRHLPRRPCQIEAQPNVALWPTLGEGADRRPLLTGPCAGPMAVSSPNRDLQS
jgi:hypothetical protein